MSLNLTNLPNVGSRLYLTDGGLETTLIFKEGFELPNFAAFDVLTSAKGKQVLKNYYRRYLEIARRNNTGFILESCTWRASRSWGSQMGYSDEALHAVNQEAVELMAEVAQDVGHPHTVLSGCMGPRGDGYVVSKKMTPDQAQAYHQTQLDSLVTGGAQMIGVLTMTHPEEAIGITWAAQKRGAPIAIGFTVETDGRLPNGQPLRDAIEMTDDATNIGPAYYMVNCAHPTHFMDVLGEDQTWLKRIGGVRANASALSHVELDEMEVLDDGDPQEFGRLYRELKEMLPNLTVMGGCCGTDHRHIESICHNCHKEAA